MRISILLLCFFFQSTVLAKQLCPDGSECLDDGEQQIQLKKKHTERIGIDSLADSTCCQVHKGKYGCCPIRDAICCSNGLYCCPKGAKCILENGTCEIELREIKAGVASLPVTNKNRQSLIICPDQTEKCLNDQTCCLLPSGKYGCCPYADGVCCSDKLHCCPNGFQCDVEGRRCIESRVNKLSLPHLPQKTKVRNVICPDRKSQCPDKNTCCKVSETEYGCCRMEDAVCCPDFLHCCPHGTSCVEGGCLGKP
ncbi:hypothetical protein B4U79_13076 [Dinothrombium tinctorium]|uniref:Granulins domain-containing protein n=1 Tax=Dinothrombium tinctorium TaxID=1965070 RepID=A0A443RLS5_9ACAR|nr:hypothetical protein B4U79_13076 [Dinothrombium tinctorium]